MPAKGYSNIAAHPDKKKIEKDLINQVPYRDTAKKYGVTIASLSRYMQGVFAPKAAQELVKKDDQNRQWIVKELTERLEDSKELQKAINEELRDPSDKSKYYFGPRSYDVEVVYRTKTGKQRKAKLQTLLDRINKSDMTILDGETKIADPRVMHIRNSEAIVKELEAIGKILGHVNEIKINVTQTPEWGILSQAIIQAVRAYPEAKETILAAFSRIDANYRELN